MRPPRRRRACDHLRERHLLIARRGDPPDERGEPKDAELPDTERGHWLLAVVPVLVVILTTVGLLYATGRRDKPPDASMWQIVGSGDSYLALLYGATIIMLGAVLAILASIGEVMNP